MIIKKLTAENFKCFGEVIEKDNTYQLINWDFTKKYANRMEVDLYPKDSHVGVHIFESNPLPIPLKITMLERHPFGSQAFIPMDTTPFLIAVAQECDQPKLDQIQFFITNGFQGVNYKKNMWHHPVLSLKKNMNFTVIDQAKSDGNLEEFFFDSLLEISQETLNQFINNE